MKLWEKWNANFASLVTFFPSTFNKAVDLEGKMKPVDSSSSSKKRRRGRQGNSKIKDPKDLGDDVAKKENYRVDIRDSDDQPPSNLAFRPHNQLLIHFDDNASKWFQYGSQYDERDSTLKTNPASDPELKIVAKSAHKYRELADAIYRREVQLFNEQNKSSDSKWVESTIRKGTLKDRIAATSVVVSTDPVHKFYALDGLFQMVGCLTATRQQTNDRVAQLAAEAIEDLFLNTFLPSDRKLVKLEQRPLHLYEASTSKHTLSPRILLLWRFEEMVKEKYEIFLRQYLARTMHGNIEAQKVSAIRSAKALLITVPEGESELLEMVTNKIGDPSRKVAAAASHELRKVLAEHPGMVNVISREVQQLAHRPHLSEKALYNCILFLNQLKLSKSRGEKNEASFSLPASLISTYFRLFEVAVQPQQDNSSKKGSSSKSSDNGMKSRLLSALLTGVNRAHPYLPENDKVMEEHVDALYRVVHTSQPSACTQSLLLLFHLVIGSDFSQQVEGQSPNTSEQMARKERFYRALYSTLSQSEMLGTGKHLTMYFNLLYKAMKYDTVSSRIISFAKKLLSFGVHCSSPVVAAILFLVNEVCKSHPILLTCYNEIVGAPDAFRVLDPSKRDPRGALTLYPNSKTGENDETIRAPGWEIAIVKFHSHPSVQHFASGIGQEISYAGDPLKDFSLASFLDKFAYRNPKSVDRMTSKLSRGDNIAQRKSGMVRSLVSVPVNDPTFLEKDKHDFHDEFFHKFFSERAKRNTQKGLPKEAVATQQDEVSEAKENPHDDDDEPEDNTNVDFNWETDSEEEAFVDSLAQKIMEDSSGDFGPKDLDEEDPEMDGWDEMYDQDDVDVDDDSDDDDENETKGGFNEVADPNSFVDNEPESDADDEPESDADDEPESDADDVDAFMDSDDDSNSDNEQESHDDENPFDNSFSSDGSESNESTSAKVPDQDNYKSSRKRRKQADVPTFAAAEEYEELIAKSWKHVSA